MNPLDEASEKNLLSQEDSIKALRVKVSNLFQEMLQLRISSIRMQCEVKVLNESIAQMNGRFEGNAEDIAKVYPPSIFFGPQFRKVYSSWS